MTILVDYKKRELTIGQKVKIIEDIPSVDGMLYENTIVKISDFDDKNKTIRVTDSLGKVWWINPAVVSASFL
tara:strand:+ start:483 stop:698 length:216 start_codon:yes stop_codon:yes gene_type:complete